MLCDGLRLFIRALSTEQFIFARSPHFRHGSSYRVLLPFIRRLVAVSLPVELTGRRRPYRQNNAGR